MDRIYKDLYLISKILKKYLFLLRGKKKIPGMIFKMPFVQSAPTGHCLQVPFISKEYVPAEQLEHEKLVDYYK